MKKKLLAMLLIAVMMFGGLNGYVSAEAATKLKAPKGVTVKTSSKKVYPVISWKKVSKASKYRVYRKTASDTSWVKVSTTSKLKAKDTKWKAEEGTVIQYAVRAYTVKSGKKVWSSRSKVVKWKVPQTTGNGSATGKGDTAVKPEPTASVQPTTKPQPTAKAEPTAKEEPTAKPQPTAGAQPTAQAQPTVKPQPTSGAQPTAQVQPTTKPEPTVKAEPTAKPEPTAQAQPTAQPQPTAQAQPTAKPQPVVRKEPVKIDSAHFPDDIFRECIRKDFDKDGDGYLSSSEIDLIWNVHCENLGVKSVKGIEYFRELKGLWCKGNHISELDLSGNPGLKGIWCSFNDFKSLDFSDCPELEWVYCFDCNLESLNIRNNPEMAYLECNSNPKLKELDLSQNKKLENLFCSKCGLTSLDLSNNPLLCELAAFYNDLETVDVSNNPKLKRLDIWHNPRLKNVDVSGLPELQYYICAWTSMTEIDVTHNPELVELVCGYNEGLRTLDLSHNPKLAYFSCECDVNLQSLDFSHNPRLYYCLAFGLSSIDEIDISKNSRLCKAYNEGVYVHETENLGYVYSKTIDYGGSGDPFDQLRHCVCFDDRTKIIADYNGTSDVPDSVVDKSDRHSDSESFVTRAEAMQALYVAAGSPKVTGTSRFKDVPAGAAYADAVKWGEDNKICFGYPNISSDTFCPNELISRQDFALMAHRFADYMKFGTAMDYGRTDWFNDFSDIDFYAWVPFTWAIQWRVLGYDKDTNTCYPHGRMTKAELKAGVAEIFDLDEGAAYSGIVGGNTGNPNE